MAKTYTKEIIKGHLERILDEHDGEFEHYFVQVQYEVGENQSLIKSVYDKENLLGCTLEQYRNVVTKDQQKAKL